MQSVKPASAPSRLFEQFLALVGVVVCLIISARIWPLVSGQQPMWPLPGLYLLEMGAMSLPGAFSVVRGHPKDGRLTWAGVGVILAFALIGAWSIGLAYLPVVAIFAITAILVDRRQRQNMVAHWGIAVVAGLAQIALMFAAIRVLDPNAMF